MSERIHDEELDTSESFVRSVLGEQLPRFERVPLTRLESSGTTNAMWRLHVPDGRDLVLRVPRTEGAVADLRREVELLPLLVSTPVSDLVELPRLVASSDSVGRPWAVLEWLDGEDAWAAGSPTGGAGPGIGADVAVALAGVVRAIGEIDVPAPGRQRGARGGPLGPLLERLDEWLSDPQWSASAMLDVAAVRRLASRCGEVVDDPVSPTFVHGDLISGNVLLRNGSLSAVIDWGGAGRGDPAQDLAPAWSIFDGSATDAFLEAMGADESARLRAIAFELEHAVGGVLYYEPRGHLLGDVMRRTLDRILATAS